MALRCPARPGRSWPGSKREGRPDRSSPPRSRRAVVQPGRRGRRL